MNNKHHTRILLGAIAALGLSAPSAFAAGYTLVPGGTQDWNSNATWSPSTGAPGTALTADTATVSGNFTSINQVVNISSTLTTGLTALTLGDTSATSPGSTTIGTSGGSLSLATGANITSAGTAGAINTISAPVTLFGGLNFLTGTNPLTITGKITPSAAAARTIDNASGQLVTLGDIDLSAGATASTVTIRNSNNVTTNHLVLAGVIADGSSVPSALTIGSRNVNGSIRIDGVNTYTGNTVLGVQGVKSVYLINSDQPFGPAALGKLTLGGAANAINTLEALNSDRTILKNTVDISRNVAAQGSYNIVVQASTITANSTQTHTNDITASGKTLTLGSAGGAYVLNNNATDKNRITTFAGAGTTIVASNIADNAGAVAADSVNLIAMNGTGTLVLTGTNAYQGGTRITSTGKVQIGNGGTTGSLAPANGNTPVVNGTGAGTLAFNRSDAVTTTITTNGLLGISQVGAGSLTLNNSQFNSGANSVGNGISASKLVVTGAQVAQASTTTNASVASLPASNQRTVTLAGGDTVSGLNLKVGQPVFLTSGAASAGSYIHSITNDTQFVLFGTSLIAASPSALTFGAGSALGTSAATTTVNNFSTLAGTGVIAGSVSVLSGGRLAPGVNTVDADSSGRGNFGAAATLSTGALTLTGANLDFDLAATAAGTSDLLSAGSSAVSFSSLSFSFNALTAGTLETGASYLLISGSGSFTGDVSSISTTFVTGLAGYIPTYSVTGSGLDVTFAAVPEPASAGLLLGAASLGGFLIRRRRKTQG